jgi:SAM-dependent methyltransferase
MTLWREDGRSPIDRKNVDAVRCCRPRLLAGSYRSDTRKASTLPEVLTDIEYACPRCRARLGLGSPQEDLRCPACGREFRAAHGIISWLTLERVHAWQAFFEGRSAAPDRDTSAANDYRTALQQRYIIAGFRNACGPIAAGARVLDAGCGNGLFWAALSGQPNVVGVDYSLGMCLLARARGMRVHHADINALPFADAQFDLIYSAEMLQCIGDLDPLLGELARVCCHDGRIVVSTLNRNSMVRRAMRHVRKLMPDKAAPADARAIMRTAGEVAAAGRHCGLSLRSVWWVHFPLPWLGRTTSEHYPLEPLATNMIVEFAKPAPGSAKLP